MKNWSELPSQMQCDEIKPYFDVLKKREKELIAKRMFDIFVSMILIVLLSPVLLGIAICIKVDSAGPVFFRQERITRYGKKFKIFKFRTMLQMADQKGTLVTIKDDNRITRVGKKIRKSRLDELPQLFNVLKGDMSFVGTRPEVEKFVKAYSDEMKATLLMPAGITSRASIEYKDEDEKLDGSEDVDKVYIEVILPEKMKYNLQDIREFSLVNDLRIMLETVGAVVKR